ncbi:MAG: hypothetical protein WKG06_37635 [Segetibacter sp.]
MPLALAFAQFIVCERVNGKSISNQQGPSLFGFDEPGVQSNKTTSFTDACGECSACTKARQMVHPDIHFSYPVISKKAAISRNLLILSLNGESLFNKVLMLMSTIGCSL